MKWLYRKRWGQLWAFITGVIVVPNVIEEIVMDITKWNFENPIWYEFVDTSIMLLVGIPFMWWLLGKMENYSYELQDLYRRKKIINDELRVLNKDLIRMAYYEPLTELPNRSKLIQDLQEKIDTIKREETDQVLIVTLLDIDRFKQINDTMGHAIGDELLKQAAGRLKELLPESFALYKYMGDDFVIVKELDQLPQYVLDGENPFPDTFTKPYYIRDEEIFITASAGISYFPDQGDTVDKLMKQADQALSSAKEKGGNQYQLFDPEMAMAAKRKLDLENGLRKAVEQDELILHYQPQIDLKSGRIIGVEALIRWQHPQLGLIPPNEFIPLSEETGEIIPIGKWVVRTALKQLREWHDKGFDELVMAINVSPMQMKRYKFPSFLSEQLIRHQIDAKFLEVEVTESVMQDFVESKRIFNEMNKIGIKVSIDDFGTGYASLSVLGALPIDYLKIDQAFIRQMDTNPKMKSIVKTIIQLGENLGVELIAEGIEEDYHAQLLIDYGCRYGQGYLFSRPVPAEEIEGLLLRKESFSC